MIPLSYSKNSVAAPRRPINQAWLIRLAVIAWWFVFAAIAFTVGSIPFLFTGRELDLRGNLLWNASWLIWCGLSFLAIALARKFPLDRARLKANLVRHFFLGFGVVLLNVAIEYALNALYSAFADDPARRSGVMLASLFGYKFHINLIIYWAIVGAANAGAYYAKFRQGEVVSSQLEAKLAQSELKALKAQLHPHFLFNTHHSIVALMLGGKNQDAIRMLTRLSDLLRATLRKTKQQFTSLKEELDTLQLYLEIQRIRFADKLETVVDAAPETLAAEVPHLLLQPLVENALQHGIDHLVAGGRLSVEIRKAGESLRIRIRDNGPGTDDPSAFLKQDGIGLSATRSRLLQLYGKRQSFSINSRAGEGTVVSLTLPFKECPPLPRIPDEPSPD